jgi:uncharacterized membrane protein
MVRHWWAENRQAILAALIVVAFAVGMLVGFRLGLMAGYREFQNHFVDPSLEKLTP